jgi:uncharacterized sporulation protein YeaH/YhbH (DUF444 family)
MNEIKGLFVIYRPAFCVRCERKWGRQTRIQSGRTLCVMCRSTVRQEGQERRRKRAEDHARAVSMAKLAARRDPDATPAITFETTLARLRENMARINAEIKRKARAGSADGT